ncbi:MAG: DUF1330 domain-containing protein [Pseudomonadota bacterium]
MSAYVVVQARIKNPDKMTEYGKVAGPTVKAHGGEVVMRAPFEVLAGSTNHDLMVMLKFPSKKQAVAWYNSSEYQAIIPTRSEAMDATFVVAGD